MQTLWNAFESRFRATLNSLGPAYGYTLTIWQTGALALSHYGYLTAKMIGLFVLGPVVLYALLLILFYRMREPPVPLTHFRYSPYAFIDFFSLPINFLLVNHIYAQIHNPNLGIPIGSFLATFIYNLFLTLKLLFVGPRKKE